MAARRSELVKPEMTPWYHCISKCVRGAALLSPSRKQWIEARLESLVAIFAIDVAGYSVMDNHLHVLAHLDMKAPRRWSKAEVLRRWTQLHPPRDGCRRPRKDLDRWIQEKQSDDVLVKTIRDRLVNLGWFMKSLKEPLARLANDEDGQEGAFWAARYKSIAVLDKPALLATCIYIDLNPLAAGQVTVPEEALFTSLYLRIERCRHQGRLVDLQAARTSAAMGVAACRGMEAGLWVCPIEDRRFEGEESTGLLEGFSLGSYLLLLDETSRLIRPGKAHVNPEADGLLERLGTTRDAWAATITCLFSRPFPRGVAFAFDREKLRDAAKKRGRRHLANLNGCPT